MGSRQGKLKAVARWLLTPDAAGPDSPESAAALRELGVPADQVAALDDTAPDAPADALQVWAWHADAVQLFRAMRTQWIVLPTRAGLWHQGLNYVALPVVEQRLGISATAATFAQLQVMEIEGQRVLNQDV